MKWVNCFSMWRTTSKSLSAKNQCKNKVEELASTIVCFSMIFGQRMVSGSSESWTDILLHLFLKHSADANRILKSSLYLDSSISFFMRREGLLALLFIIITAYLFIFEAKFEIKTITNNSTS